MMDDDDLHTHYMISQCIFIKSSILSQIENDTRYLDHAPLRILLLYVVCFLFSHHSLLVPFHPPLTSYHKKHTVVV